MSNKELVHYCAMLIDSQQSLPVGWQTELLRRFIALAPANEHPPFDPDQLDLFK